MFLTPEELEELTGRKKKKLQRDALARMGVPFRLRVVDGYPLVLRSFFESLTKQERRREPRLDLMQ